MSKSHPEQWVVNETVERPDPALVAALGELSTTQIADCGGPVGVVGPGVRRLAGAAEVCGLRSRSGRNRATSCSSSRPAT